MALFGPEILKRFHYLSLVGRRMGGSPLLAAPRKKLPGGGTEVTGYRDYTPGDDFYHINWTWCARFDELLVKVFEANTDQTIHLLLDCSPSMALGHPSKFRLARQVAAALGFVALANMDRLGVAAFAEGLVADLPPLRHPSRLPRLLRFLERLEPGGGRTQLARAAETLMRRFPRPGPVVVLSDLYDPEGYQRPFDLLRFHGYEPRLVQLLDPHEADPGLLGDVELFDVETQTVRQVTITERTAARHRVLVAEFQASVRDYCSRTTTPCMQFPCDMPEEEVLLRALGGKRNAQPEQRRTVASTS